MEQIIRKLSEIENIAGKIMEEALCKKKELSQRHQEQCQEYDRQADEEAEKRIGQIRAQLKQKQETQYVDLKKQAEDEFARMERYYTEQHQQLARGIFEKIIHM